MPYAGEVPIGTPRQRKATNAKNMLAMAKEYQGAQRQQKQASTSARVEYSPPKPIAPKVKPNQDASSVFGGMRNKYKNVLSALDTND